ncbi:alpha/beta fold hydrolase [Streptomyces chromofuscus]|uniref:alpha/beta fold hydrolase n=1 Tax=Streptomyces chromofuscus TaxID=42881 RepID=UPI001673283C|nr:alpha/beta hydrolase [Streptomyces chromofuscus]GGT38372.1 3-oxoadipate enol-lactone hydrolase [Streptomyces chromofuscus]
MMFDWGNQRLHCTDEGTGPPILFLHGLGGNSSNWLHQRRHFSKTHRVIALDLPGHGRSTGVDVSFREYRDAIEAALDHCEIDQVSIIGLSKGARAGLSFTAHRPERVHKLVIVNAFLHLTPEDRRSRLDLYGLLLQPGGLRLWGERLLRQMGVREHTAISRGFIASLSSITPVHLHSIFRELVDIDQRPELQNLRKPILLIRGEKDAFIPPYCMEEMSAICSTSEVLHLPDSGHLPYLDDPVRFNKAIESFLFG